jgi:hypothetical protein
VIIAGGTLRFAGPLDQLGNRTVFIQVAEVERQAQASLAPVSEPGSPGRQPSRQWM